MRSEFSSLTACFKCFEKEKTCVCRTLYSTFLVVFSRFQEAFLQANDLVSVIKEDSRLLFWFYGKQTGLIQMKIIKKIRLSSSFLSDNALYLLWCANARLFEKFGKCCNSSDSVRHDCLLVTVRSLSFMNCSREYFKCSLLISMFNQKQ